MLVLGRVVHGFPCWDTLLGEASQKKRNCWSSWMWDTFAFGLQKVPPRIEYHFKTHPAEKEKHLPNLLFWVPRVCFPGHMSCLQYLKLSKPYCSDDILMISSKVTLAKNPWLMAWGNRNLLGPLNITSLLGEWLLFTRMKWSRWRIEQFCQFWGDMKWTWIVVEEEFTVPMMFQCLRSSWFCFQKKNPWLKVHRSSHRSPSLKAVF